MPARDSGQGFRPKRLLTSHSGLSILALDGHQKLTSKPLSQATSAATTPTSVLSVLSASLYPIPEDQSHSPEVRDRVPAYGGFTPIQQEIENDDGHFTAQTSPDALSSGAQNNSPKRPWTKPEETAEIKPPRKRGRPRKIVNFDNAGSDERRRTQLRLAQRAYRCRKETKISTLENRIAELENTIKRMGGSREALARIFLDKRA